MKILFHAPSPRSLERARFEAARLTGLSGDRTIRIIATLEGAVAAVRQPHTTDPLLILCSDSLHSASISPAPGVEVTPNGTELIAKLQRKGWSYVHG